MPLFILKAVKEDSSFIFPYLFCWWIIKLEDYLKCIIQKEFSSILLKFIPMLFNLVNMFLQGIIYIIITSFMLYLVLLPKFYILLYILLILH
ncbi:unnamed protein product [Blepharisma stoltei]|uniref:Uncharacterized protein n=1 Tax=Blepharisma stoltei TaxID=1481888 RepID=A0AAU9JRZ0_9CILI|nr:unnamed protein product [Blepharisma stoltei]